MLVVAVLPVLSLISFFSPRQKRIHSLCLIGLSVSISKPDINDGFCMAPP